MDWGIFHKHVCIDLVPHAEQTDMDPSGSTIGFVWTILYSAMAIAAWIVWFNGGWMTQLRPLLIYAAQLILNAGWSFLFWYAKSWPRPY